MPAYVILLRYTQQGIQNIKQAPARLQEGKQALKAAGAELRAFYLLMGEYDALAVIEAPDDKTVAQFALARCSMGNIRTTTMRAFSEGEFREIVDEIPIQL